MKRILAVLITAALLIGLIPTAGAAAVKFKDITENFSWAADHISYFVESGVVDGVSPDSFAPNSNITREQFAKLLVLAFNDIPMNSSVASFSDVPSTKWSYGYVESAKDFMDYTAKVDGSKTFRPQDYATREEIAAAVVKVLGLTDADLINKNYAADKFKDFGSVSSSLAVYVTLAAERGIIAGTTDTTFEPKAGITRAAAVVMLSRAAKLTSNSIYNKAGITVTVDKGKTVDDRVITVKGPEHSVIKVDGNVLTLKSNGDMTGTAVINYTFPNEMIKEFAFYCDFNGKISDFKIVLSRVIDAPVLRIEDSPATVYENTYTFQGIADDRYDYNVKIYMNGVQIDVKNFIKQVTLEKGLNTFTFYAENKASKRSATITRTIYYEGDLPYVHMDPVADTTENGILKITGTAGDPNGGEVDVYLNGEKIGTKTFEQTVTLKEGTNSFEIYARNSEGKTSVKTTFTVQYVVVVPILSIDDIPDSVKTKTVSVSGRVTNDSSATVYVNGLAMTRSQFSTIVDLTPGQNVITVKAISKNGRESAVYEKTVTFAPEAPVIAINVGNITVKTDTYVLTGKASDSNDSSPMIYVNGEYVGTGSFTKTLNLKDGPNAFTVVAINIYGLESTQAIAKITFNSITPEIHVDQLPTLTYSEEITVKGYIIDFDSNCKFYINGSGVAVDTLGNFSKAITLQVGDNELVLKVVNGYGKETVIKATVRYKPYS